MSAPKILSHNPLYRRIASLFLVVFIAIWSAGTTNIFAQSNYCNAIFVVSNFLNQAVNVQRLTITPYMPGPSYNGAFLSPTIPAYTRANSPSLTNGTLTVSNLIMDYAYTVQITDNYTNSKSQIFLDSRLIGTNGNTVYAANYTSQNGNPNGPYAIPYLPWFSSTVISNITYMTGGGTTYSNSTDSAGVVSGSTIGTNLTEYATLTGATNIAAEQVAPWTNQVTPSAISDAGGITNYQTSPIFTSAIKITNSTSGNSTTYGQSGGKMQMQIFGNGGIGTMSLSTNGTFMLNGVVIYTNNIFTGDGSSLTNLNASQLTTGTLPDARLSGNVVFQNSTNIITNLWVSLYPQPSSVGYNSAPVPRIYCMSSAFGYGLGYSYLTNEIYEMVTNSLPNYGVDWYEIDAGWSQRDTNTGALIVNSDWPVNGKQFCDWAKSLGIKLQFYTALTPTNSAFWTNGYPTTYGSAISTGHEVDDAATFAAWGASGVKFDQFGATMADSLLFSSALKSANGMFVQVTPNIGECFDIHWPLYLNARYAAAGQADPTIPFNFTNLYSHFVVEASALGLAYIKPGFYGEGVGWQINNSPQYLGSGYGIGFPKYYYPYPHHVSADMALMLCSEIQWPGANEPMYLSKDFLLAYRDPLVIPARTVATTITSDGMTNYTLVRQIGTFDNYNRCFMFLNASTNNQSFTITTTNLGIPPGVFTLSSPWSQSIETWATNSFTVSVPPTNDVVYSVKTGFMAPAITDGAYLTSMPYRLTDFLTKNNDSGGVYDKGTNITRGQIQTYDRILYGTDLAGNVPQINSSYYTNGITFGYNTNVTMSYTLGGAASTFSGAFGIQQRWNGGGGTNRLSLYADNSLLFQSGWITNNSMATNFNVSVVGANILKIVVDSSGVLESCLGNPQLGVTSTATTNVYYATLTSSFLVNSNFVGATKTNVSDLSLSLPSGDYELVFNGVASETGASGGGSAFTIASSSSATIWGGLLLYQDDITAPFIRYYSGTTSITIGVSDSAGKINDYLLTTKLSVPTATTISVSAASYNATTNYFNILPVTYLKATKLK